MPAEHAVAVWDALFAAGAAFELRACGLGARDTLRTEMGYPLHGQDLSLDITPVQARSGWAVGWDKPAFWGRDALLAEKAAGPRRTLRGLEAVDRAIPRARDDRARRRHAGRHDHQRHLLARPASRASRSPCWTPPPKLADGDLVEVDIRGRRAQMRLTRPPFVTPSVR